MEYFQNCYFACTQLVLTDIYPVQYGEEQCKPGHDFGFCMRSNYLLHYVYSGKGSFWREGKEYSVCEGQMFLIRPYELTYYRADEKEPWLYRWIEFNGSMIPEMLERSGFAGNVCVCSDEKKKIGEALSMLVQGGEMQFELLMHRLWWLCTLFADSKTKEHKTVAQEYVRKAESFIKINLHKKIHVTEVADYVGIDRSYLSRLFRDSRGISLQQYILKMKMNAAANYMKSTNISIQEAAMSVGYTDSRVFNKAFKSQFLVSPSEWRRRQQWEQSVLQ